MARVANTYVCKVLEPTTAEGEVLNGASLQVELRNTEVDHTGTPSTVKGVKLKAASKIQGKFAAPTLATGEAVTSAQIWVYCKTSTAAEDGTLSMSPGIASKKLEGGTTPAWVSVLVGASGLQTALEREELAFIIKWIKAVVTVYEVYLEIKTETETSVMVTPAIAPASPSGKANAEKQFKTGVFASGLRHKGFLARVDVSTSAGTGATALIDSLGNTYEKVGEASNGSSCTVQIWVAEIVTTGANVSWTATVGAEGVTVCISPVEYTPIAATSRLVASAGGSGTGTTASTAGLTPRASQGDVLFASFVSVGGGVAEHMTPSAPLKTPEADNTASFEISIGNLEVLSSARNSTPTEGAEQTPTGVWSESNTWAAVAVSLRVLASTGGGESFSGPLFGTFALASIVTGVKTAASAISQRLGFNRQLAGSKTTAGSLTQQTAVSTSFVAGKSRTGALSQSIAVTGSATGRKVGVGAFVSTLATASKATGRKITTGALRVQVAASSSLAARKLTGGALSNTVAFVGQILQLNLTTAQAVPTRMDIAPNLSMLYFAPQGSIVAVEMPRTKIAFHA
jgi:hypothetical protein